MSMIPGLSSKSAENYLLHRAKLFHVIVSLQALDIPFKAVGASEANPAFRSVIQANFAVEHLHSTMMQQVDGEKCLLHAKTSCGCSLQSCDLCIFGTPCNPFSEMGTKRYRDGSIAQHVLAPVTFRDAKNMIVSGNHKAIVMEQVAGFDKPECAGSGKDTTPMRRPGTSAAAAALLAATY